MLVCCPGCRLEAELPNDGVSGCLLTCPRCRLEFQYRESGVHSVAPPIHAKSMGDGRAHDQLSGAHSLTSLLDDEMSAWAGVDLAPAAQTPPPRGNLAATAFPANAIRPPILPRGSAEVITAETAAAHVDWIEKEVARFNRFMTQQLDLIQKTRLDLTRADSQLTAAMLSREQELNREKSIVAARTSALDQREAGLAELRSTLESRRLEVERMEETVRKRLQEVDEIKQTLREEFEESEREIHRQQLVVEEAARNLRNQMASAPVADATPDLLESLRLILKNFESGSHRFPASSPGQ